MQSKNALGNLKNRYKAVLEKCNLINVFGSLAVITAITTTLSIATLCMPQSAQAITVDTDIVTIEEVQAGTNYYTTYTGGDGKSYGVIFEDSNSGTSSTSSIANLILRSGSKVGSGTDWKIVEGTTSSGLAYYPNFTIDGISFTVTQSNDSALIGTSNGVDIYTDMSSIEVDFYLLSEEGVYRSGGGTIDTIDSNFIGNSSGEGAGINIASGSITTINSNFIANNVYDAGGSGNESGAAINVESGTIDTIESNFIGNIAQQSGGAISIGRYGTVNTINSNFIGNSSLSASANAGGGALHVLKTIDTISSNFIANTASSVGGAIYTRDDLNFVADNNFHIFTGNKDKSGYNAIYVDRADYGTPPGEVSLSFNMQGSGGFIINDSIRGDYSTFGTIDPAITNVYDFSITGENAANNIFYFNNTASKVKAFSLSKANLSLGSVTQGGTISHGTISAQSATFSGDSILTLNAPLYTTNAAFQSSGSAGTLTVQAGAKLQIVNGAIGDIIHVVDGFTNSASTIATGAWDGENLKSTSSLQLVKVADFDPAVGSYSIKIAPLSPGSNGVDALLNEYPDMQEETAKLLVEFSQVSQGTNSSDVFDALFSRIFDNNDPYNMGTDNPWLATLTAEGLLQLGIIAETAPLSHNVNNMSLENLHARLNNFLAGKSSNILSSEDVSNAQSGISAGGLPAGSEENSIQNGFAVWATPFYNNTQVSGFKAGAFDTGYDNNLGGLSFGVDYTFQKKYRLGLAISGGGGSSESNGDFNTITNDFGFIGTNLYGAMYLNNFTLMADVSYTYVGHSLEQELPSALGYSSAKADVHSNVFSIGTEGYYLFEMQGLDIIPHVGFRYTNIYTSSYNVKVSGANVVHTQNDSQDIFSIPLGLTLSKDFVTASNWNITPSLNLGMTFSFGDLDANAVSSLPGIARSASYQSRNIDEVTFNGGIGFEMAKNNLSFGLNYDLQASSHLISHALQATFRYEF